MKKHHSHYKTEVQNKLQDENVQNVFMCMCTHCPHVCEVQASVHDHAENRGRHQKLCSLPQSHKSGSLTELEALCFN